MQIGPIQLENGLFLAPMAGVTDRPFRAICRRLGAGMATSEMITADTALWGRRKTLRRLDFGGEPGPLSVQIVGTDPAAMAEAARANVDRGAAIIDINMGCPARKVCRVAAGSALLRDEPLVGRILEAVTRAVEVPVTLKMRTGWDPASRNGVSIARIAEAAGISAIAVHGRTRACGFSGSAEYETIRRIKAAVSIPVIANGDVASPEQARRVLACTGADGLMVGRAARGRPWIFAEIDHFLRTGERRPSPGLRRVEEILLAHLEALYGLYGERHGTRIARKHVAWYSRGHPGGADLRRRVNSVESTREQKTLIRAHFDRLATRQELAA